jgi:hypothetical protein
MVVILVIVLSLKMDMVVVQLIHHPFKQLLDNLDLDKVVAVDMDLVVQVRIILVLLEDLEQLLLGIELVLNKHQLQKQQVVVFHTLVERLFILLSDLVLLVPQRHLLKP